MPPTSPGHRPQPVLGPQHRADGEPGHRGPCGEVERRGAEQVAGAEDEPRHGRAGSGQGLRGGPAAELAGDERGEQHGHPRRERGRGPQGHERARHEAVHEPCEQRHERALVRVAPGRPVPGGQEVQLVAVVAVASGGDQQDE